MPKYEFVIVKILAIVHEKMATLLSFSQLEPLKYVQINTYEVFMASYCPKIRYNIKYFTNIYLHKYHIVFSQFLLVVCYNFYVYVFFFKSKLYWSTALRKQKLNTIKCSVAQCNLNIY